MKSFSWGTWGRFGSLAAAVGSELQIKWEGTADSQCPARGTNKERSEQGKCSHVHLGTSQRGSSVTRDSLWVTVSLPSIKKCVALLNFSYFSCLKVERNYWNFRRIACGLQELDNHQLCTHIFSQGNLFQPVSQFVFPFLFQISTKGDGCKYKFLFVALRAVPRALIRWCQQWISDDVDDDVVLMMFRAAVPPGSQKAGTGESSEGKDGHECPAEVSSAFAAAGAQTLH